MLYSYQIGKIVSEIKELIKTQQHIIDKMRKVEPYVIDKILSMITNPYHISDIRRDGEIKFRTLEQGYIRDILIDDIDFEKIEKLDYMFDFDLTKFRKCNLVVQDKESYSKYYFDIFKYEELISISDILSIDDDKKKLLIQYYIVEKIIAYVVSKLKYDHREYNPIILQLLIRDITEKDRRIQIDGEHYGYLSNSYISGFNVSSNHIYESFFNFIRFPINLSFVIDYYREILIFLEMNPQLMIMNKNILKYDYIYHFYKQSSNMSDDLRKFCIHRIVELTTEIKDEMLLLPPDLKSDIELLSYYNGIKILSDIDETLLYEITDVDSLCRIGSHRNVEDRFYEAHKVIFENGLLHTSGKNYLLKYIDFSKPTNEVNQYVKLALSPISYQYKKLLNIDMIQVAENTSPLFLGGSKKIKMFNQIRKYLLTDSDDLYIRNDVNMFALSCSFIFNSFDDFKSFYQKVNYTGDFFSSFLSNINSVCSKLKFPSRENIKEVQKYCKYIREFAYRNSDRLNHYENMVSRIFSFIDEFDRLPKNRQELYQFLTKNIGNVSTELIDYIIELDIYNYEDYVELWNDYVSKRLDKQRDIIPDVYITSDKYTFRKVHKNEPLMMFLGHYTRCCQVLDNAAESCVRYGMYKENSGFYVIEQNGVPIIQSWVWIKDNVLVFDSFESRYRDVSPKVIKLVEKAFNKILNESDIKEIRIGDNSFGITPNLKNELKFIPVEPVRLSDYDGYTDAKKQLKYFHINNTRDGK